ncbi:MAG: efflux RND transporter periplasmic adaptor subunit [Planctomycetes bacterium]|nr:efflux RND transporter periplasmic adaptor subunit [Planctomycetota bacterium]
MKRVSNEMPDAGVEYGGLSALAGAHTTPAHSVLMSPPLRHWKTRYFLPLLLISFTVALLTYAARATFRSEIDVWVVPVVAKPVSADEPAGSPSTSSGAPDGGGAAVIAQAPGWIEADPFPITVPALAEGVISEVLIVEGQRVAAGDVVARMVAADAALAANAAAAELAATEAELRRARAASDYQRVNYDRLLRLHQSQNAPDIEWASATRDREEAEAQVNFFEAKLLQHRVICDQAKLTLSRMEIVSPVNGVVMNRLVEPGTRISMSNISSGERMGAVARLYDPQKLQVRVDVPLSDCAKIGVGTRADVLTEAISETTFQGEVTRLVHEANIQRNTVQVKVAIRQPVPTLKPEMLCRVRFLSTSPGSAGSQPGAHRSGSFHLLAPRNAIISVTNERGKAWIVDRSHRSSGPVAAMREVLLGGAAPNGLIEITDGLQPGDRIIVDPPTALKPGVGIRVLGEKAQSLDNP